MQLYKTVLRWEGTNKERYPAIVEYLCRKVPSRTGTTVKRHRLARVPWFASRGRLPSRQSHTCMITQVAVRCPSSTVPDGNGQAKKRSRVWHWGDRWFKSYLLAAAGLVCASTARRVSTAVKQLHVYVQTWSVDSLFEGESSRDTFKVNKEAFD